MSRSSSAAIKQMDVDLRLPDMRASIHCALVAKPDPVEKQQRRVVRYSILAIALAAVILLIAIAVFYIHGNSVTIVHVSTPVTALGWLGGLTLGKQRQKS